MMTLNDCIIPDERDIESIVHYAESVFWDRESDVVNLKNLIRSIMRGHMCEAISNYIEYQKEN